MKQHVEAGLPAEPERSGARRSQIPKGEATSGKSFEDYLQFKRLRKGSITDILCYKRRFLEWLETENLNVETCTYTDLLSLVKIYRDKGFSIHNQNKHILGIKHYYNYLKHIGKVNYNPAINLLVKGNIQKLPRDILSKEQLEEMYENYQPETEVQKRNKIMLGLLIYQGLTRNELDKLEPNNINLEKGIILIKRNVKLKQRILKLTACQILPLQEYLTETRQVLQKLRKQKTNKLLINTGREETINEILRELLRELRSKHDFLKSFIQVRNSVISHWLQEKNIREVQYLAGHGSIKSTQRYAQVNLQELTEQLNKYHPLK